MAGEHFAELGVDGAGVELAGRGGDVEGTIGERQRAIVDDELGALAQRRRQLDLARLVGAERRDVHAREDQRLVEDRRAARRHRDDDVGAVDGVARGGRGARFDLE